MTTLRQIEVKAAVEALIECGFNQSEAAKLLDISRGTLRKLVAEHTGKSTKFAQDLIKEGIVNAA